MPIEYAIKTLNADKKLTQEIMDKLTIVCNEYSRDEAPNGNVVFLVLLNLIAQRIQQSGTAILPSAIKVLEFMVELSENNQELDNSIH